MKQLNRIFIVAIVCFAIVSSECYNKCSGHGTCDTSNRCICHRQLGLGLNEADFEAPMYTGADCSERMCPTGVAFAPVIDDEEYFEVVNVGGKLRQLFDIREMAGTEGEDEGGENTGTDKGDEPAPTTPGPTESIDNIISQDFENRTTELEKPIEVFKPVTSNTPSLGGAMRCKDGENGWKYISIVTQVDNKIVADEKYENLGECQVTYVRKDLSLSGVLDFKESPPTATWENGEELRLYGFQYNTTYDVNVACVFDETTGVIQELSNKVTLLNENSESVKFTYHKAKKEKYPAFCYLLTVGVDSNSKVQNIDLLSSELAEMVGKSSDGLVFGQNIENGAVVVMNGDDVFPDKNRMLAEGDPKEGPYAYVLRLDKEYNPAKPTDAPTTTPEENTTPSASASASPSRILSADPTAVAGTDFSAYKKYLQVGNKVFIRVLVGGKTFATPQTLHIVQETQTCEAYCKDNNDKCGINTPTTKGCYVIFLSEKIIKDKDAELGEGDRIYFTLTAVGIHPTYECSGVGKCNRQTGQCECLAGYTGDACQILTCPNDCSNHGRCVKSSQAIIDGSTAFAASVPTMFGYQKEAKQKLYGCICDKGYRGPDCSLLECPSAEDPSGGSNKEETGEFRDCSGRGICDYTTGNCQCFDGFVGTACETIFSSM